MLWFSVYEHMTKKDSYLFYLIVNEAENKMKPIGIHELAIGSTHAFAVLDNAIIKGATSSESAVVHGRDTLSW